MPSAAGSRAGVTVVSGLAFGIDAACHRGALAGGGAIAVLGVGARPRLARAATGRSTARCAEPARSSRRCRRGAAPWRWLFPARNRIMAALAEMTVVVEAAERSGSLITATLALELGRTVGAMPGRAGARLAGGNNGLIRDGAADPRRDGRARRTLRVGARPSSRRPRAATDRRRPGARGCSTRWRWGEPRADGRRDGLAPARCAPRSPGSSDRPRSGAIGLGGYVATTG